MKEEEITCDWEGPMTTSMSSPCWRPARYFYIDEWDNVVARCYEHNFYVKERLTKREYIVHKLMGE